MAFDTASHQQLYADLAKCRELPTGSPRDECALGITKEGLAACEGMLDGTDEGSRKANVCYLPYDKKAREDCKDLPDHPISPSLDCMEETIADEKKRTAQGRELKEACPDKVATALNLGKDFKGIEQIDAEGHASQLATLRLKILDLSTPLADEDLETYGEALRNFFYNSLYGNESIIKAVGLSSIDEFTAMYVYEVADALRDRGDRYYGVAGFFEGLLDLVEIVNNE